MKNLGYYNGAYGRIEDIYIPMTDRACYFGDGVYDATYSRNHVPFALKEHVDRLYLSAALIDIDIPYSKEELCSIIKRMTAKVDSGDNFVYFQVSRGQQIRDHLIDKNVKPSFWIIIKEAAIKDMKKSVSAITLEDNRYNYCNIKTINLLPNIIYANKADSKGCYEAILHRNGRLTECAHSNVGLIKDGKFVTPKTDCTILSGIARAHIIKQCKKIGVEVEERDVLLEELFTADEVIVCSAGSLCLRVSNIDGNMVGGKNSELITVLQDMLLEEFWEETQE